MASLGAGIMTLGLVSVIHQNSYVLLGMGCGITGITAFQWWRDINREATYQGLHTIIVQQNMR